jgi:hypothetical protein
MRRPFVSPDGSKSVDITEVQDSRAAWLPSLLEAVRGLRYGAVELLVHDGRVVQIERRERLRVEPDARPPQRERNPANHDRADRTSGGFEAIRAEEKR